MEGWTVDQLLSVLCKIRELLNGVVKIGIKAYLGAVGLEGTIRPAFLKDHIS